MRNLGFLVFVLVAVAGWGVYGPVLHQGQARMGAGSELSLVRPFVCVGIAYFVIAVVVPLVLLIFRGESGQWTIRGLFWSVLAGSAGAVGALGIVLAHVFGGRPVFVMPLVFGLAPVVNTIVAMLMARTIRQAVPLFYAAVLAVALGGAGVMVFKPSTGFPSGERAAEANISPESPHWIGVVGAILMTALAWGTYGPVLHKGQSRMGGSRLRPFLGVGLAYFVLAVALPVMLRGVLPPDPGAWNTSGTLWSLAGGTAGAVGALGVILAFNSGGRPVFVMPLVFGGAPVVNTLTTTAAGNLWHDLRWPFLASLALVIIGAVAVLTLAPRAPTHSPASKPP